MKFFLWLIVLYAALASSVDAMPLYREVKESFKKSDAVLLDRHGKIIHELRVDAKGRRLQWTGIKDISPSLVKAVIQSEDRRFYEHHGVDWKAVGYATIGNLLNKGARGASTITMQLVSVLDKKLRPRTGKRTFSQKWDQIGAARDLEKTWTKDEIIETYLNLITFRGELQGISAASRGLFDKEPAGLDEQESLILASLIRGPNAPIEAVSKRACMLKDPMKSLATCEDLARLSEKTLGRIYSVRQAASLAPHVAHSLLKSGSTTVVSTLDGDLQRVATEVLKSQLIAVKSQNVRDGAIMVLDNKTGDILAYVASSDLQSTAREVDGIRARRQAGSILKPFLYALAIEKKILTPASVLEDGPLDVPTTNGIYKPGDYENDFKGMVSARTALASSLNIPAVRVLSLAGIENFIQRLKLLGLTQLESDDHYGLSLALGSADVSLYELTNAYRTLANKGVWSSVRLTPENGNRQSRRVFSEEAAFLISDILSDREARSATFSLENPLATRFWSAVKTGTSKDMRDNWCIGYSKKYTVGVWVGNFTGEPMWNVSGVTGAAPAWLEVMNYLHKGERGGPPEAPRGVIASDVRFEDKVEPQRNEWFIKGTEPLLIQTNGTNKRPRIIYPASGTIIALDPDIPEDQQLVFFEAQPGSGSLTLVLNNRTMGHTKETVSWKPVAGDYKLALIDANNKIVDVADFKVRGK